MVGGVDYSEFPLPDPSDIMAGVFGFMGAFGPLLGMFLIVGLALGVVGYVARMFLG